MENESFLVQNFIPILTMLTILAALFWLASGPTIVNIIPGFNGWLNREQAKHYVNRHDLIPWGTDHNELFDVILSRHGVVSCFGYYRQSDLDSVLAKRHKALQNLAHRFSQIPDPSKYYND